MEVIIMRQIIILCVLCILSCGTDSDKTNLLQLGLRNKVTFLGDSNTYLMGNLSRYNPDYINMGIGGTTTMEQLFLLYKTEQLTTGKVVLIIGTNDITKILTPGVLGGITETESDFLSNYRMILSILCNRYESKNIYCVSILPVTTGWAGWTENRNEYIIRMNFLIKEMVEQCGATFIDEWNDFCNAEGRLKSEYTEDGYHINSAGQDIHMQNIMEVLHDK